MLVAICAVAAADDVEFHNSRGILSFEQGDYENAIGSFQKAMALSPENETIRLNLVKSLWKRAEKLDSEGKTEEAIRTLIPALELDPDDVQILLYLASLHVNIGHHRLAEVHLRETLESDPQLSEASFLLGDVLYHRGEYEEAITHWSEAKKSADGRISRHSSERIKKTKREMQVEKGFSNSIRGHFLLRYRREDMDRVIPRVSTILEEAYREIGAGFGLYPVSPVTPIPVVIYSENDFYRATGAVEQVGGLFDGKMRLKIGGEGPLNEEQLRKSVFHEHTHVLVYLLARNNCPFWLNEGLAQYHTEEWTQGHKDFLQEIFAEPGAKYTPSLSDLNETSLDLTDKEFSEAAYLKSFAVVKYLRDRYPSRQINRLLKQIGFGKEPEEALREITGLSYDDLEKSSGT